MQCYYLGFGSGAEWQTRSVGRVPTVREDARDRVRLARGRWTGSAVPDPRGPRPGLVKEERGRRCRYIDNQASEEGVRHRMRPDGRRSGAASVITARSHCYAVSHDSTGKLGSYRSTYLHPGRPMLCVPSSAQSDPLPYRVPSGWRYLHSRGNGDKATHRRGQRQEGTHKDMSSTIN